MHSRGDQTACLVHWKGNEWKGKRKKTIETCSQNINDIQAHKIITLNAPMEKEKNKWWQKKKTSHNNIHDIVCDMQCACAMWIEQYMEITTGYWTFYKAMCITFIVHCTSFALDEELYVFVYLFIFSDE